ncbi:hypothetical protein [Legionella israelensis]|uniref:Ras-GEF domain-containing protein n=1 Tax=Legionella israelensis TaxID=454 RepID=A0A0W0VL05_9GAMM|nr:hypothetical protein [Legionella israelensis]KTD20788.1 hypothetical protein Lisr_1687 [Legionella israelensis]QBS10980.1 hypothetical protein E4T55_14695 [Legionella israelensis]SCY06126.1 hypothetical protein SAMN02746069_01143 [Legionella israelensis DSM 19235]STX57974.1 Uncharacterised protein [Legionella israelensis]
MSKKLFRQWLDEYSKIYPEHVVAGDIDRIISDKNMQASIRKSQTNLALYLFLETKITSDYARLIDTKLREAFCKLDLLDFKDPSGFAQYKLASLELRSYLHLRNQFESFIEKDIFQHVHEDSRLNAFRRWVDVAAYLFNTGCYEGYHLVIVKLQQLEMKVLLDGLTSLQRKKYNQLAQLSRSNGRLCAYVDSDHRPSCFKPVPLWSLSLSATLETLGADKHQPLSLFPQNHPNYMEAKKRDGLYEEINRVLNKKPEKLPFYLEKTYDQIQADLTCNIVKKRSHCNSHKQSSVSKLYSHGLLPSFWHRSCRGESKIYKDMYATSKTEMPQFVVKI